MILHNPSYVFAFFIAEHFRFNTTNVILLCNRLPVSHTGVLHFPDTSEYIFFHIRANIVVTQLGLSLTAPIELFIVLIWHQKLLTVTP